MPAGVKPSLHAVEGAPWTTILEKTALRGNGDNLFADRRSPAVDAPAIEHLSRRRRRAAPRLRRSGRRLVAHAPAGRVVDLALDHERRLVPRRRATLHYGTQGALIMPGRAKNMGDGWETKRRRGPGHDWAIVRLGAPGDVSKVEIDTNHFKGNYPDRASLEGCLSPTAGLGALQLGRRGRRSCRKRSCRRTSGTSFQASNSSRSAPFRTCGSTFFPTAASAACASMARSHEIDTATPEAARAILSRACGSPKWVDRMMARRPFAQRREAAVRGAQRVVRPDGSGLARSVRRSIRTSAIAPRSMRAFPKTHDLSSKEQAGVGAASADVIDRARRGE